jgi:flagellar protein FlaG
MGMRIDLAGYPGLDPAAGTTPSGASAAVRRVESSTTPATAQPMSVAMQSLPAGNTAGTGSTELESALEGINQYLHDVGSSLNFIHDEASGRSAVQVVDEQGRVIRQIPPQEMLDAYARVRNIVGILLDESG